MPKKDVDVPRRSEKGRQARNVILVVKSLKKEAQVAVEKLKAKLESKGCGNGVGTGHGTLGIAGTAAVPAPSCWDAMAPGAVEVDVVVGT